MPEEKYPSRYAMVNGLRYHYKIAGPAEGKLVLLHGFPEFWYGWTKNTRNFYSWNKN